MSEFHPTHDASPADRAAHGGLTCWEFDNFIVDYFEGALNPEARALFEAHLATCPPCRAYLADYQRASRAAKASYTDDAPADAPEELIETILAALKL